METNPTRHATALAARFAQELGLRPGNLWEPGLARSIARDLRASASAALVEREWRFRLGLA